MGQGISTHAAFAPHKTALIGPDRTLTYRQLDERSTRLAAALAAEGARAGGNVAVMLPNSVEWFEAGAAVSKLDAGMVPVNHHLEADELAWILEDSKADVLVTTEALREAWDGVSCPVVTDLGAAIASAGDGVAPLEAGPARSPVFYTSGTTGRPKGVVHGLIDRERVELGQKGQEMLWSWTSEDVYVPVRPRLPRRPRRVGVDGLAPCEIWELYGASEGGATRISPDEWLAHPGSVGRPWPGVEVRILDGDGQPVGPGETGLIYVAPAGGARFHYHDDPEKTALAWRDRAFTVGDVGHLDDEGYLYSTDRASDMVIRGGVNVYPREVEEVLHRHPDVVDCAVFGVRDPRLGEELKAMVEVRPGSELTETDVQEWCRAHLASYKAPAAVDLVGELPRDPSGKGKKRLLREAHWAGAGGRI